TRSANNTDTKRRSAAGASRRCTGTAAAAPGKPASDAPHSKQNFRPGSFGVPQAGQSAANPAPHSPQNFASARFSAPQLEQTVTSKSLRSYASERYRRIEVELGALGELVVGELGDRLVVQALLDGRQ